MTGIWWGDVQLSPPSTDLIVYAWFWCLIWRSWSRLSLIRGRRVSIFNHQTQPVTLQAVPSPRTLTTTYSVATVRCSHLQQAVGPRGAWPVGRLGYVTMCDGYTVSRRPTGGIQVCSWVSDMHRRAPGFESLTRLCCSTWTQPLFTSLNISCSLILQLVPPLLASSSTLTCCVA